MIESKLPIGQSGTAGLFDQERPTTSLSRTILRFATGLIRMLTHEMRFTLWFAGISLAVIALTAAFGTSTIRNQSIVRNVETLQNSALNELATDLDIAISQVERITGQQASLDEIVSSQGLAFARDHPDQHSDRLSVFDLAGREIWVIGRVDYRHDRPVFDRREIRQPERCARRARETFRPSYPYSARTPQRRRQGLCEATRGG